MTKCEYSKFLDFVTFKEHCTVGYNASKGSKVENLITKSNNMTGWEIAGQAQFLEKFYGLNFESSRGWRHTTGPGGVGVGWQKAGAWSRGV